MGQGNANTTYDAYGNPQEGGLFEGSTGFAMSPDDYAASFRNINPYTQQAANALFGGNVSNFINQGLGGSPTAGFDQFISQQAPALAGLMQGTVQDYNTGLMEQASRQAESGYRAANDALGARNANFSSAGDAARLSAYTNPFAQAALQQQGNYQNMLGGLYNTQLPLAQQQQMQYAQLASGLLGQQAQFGDQMMVNPDMTTSPSGWNQFWGAAAPVAEYAGNIANVAAGA